MDHELPELPILPEFSSRTPDFLPDFSIRELSPTANLLGYIKRI
jgi:hypothetical protein